MENSYEQESPRYGLAEGGRYASNRLMAAHLRVLSNEPTLPETNLLRRAQYEGQAWLTRNGMPEYECTVERQVFRAEVRDEFAVEGEVAGPVSLDAVLQDPVV
ncbi:hypothetical protein C4580_04085 [Candidatus Woesearchaeota archaeon]|nr:MAG: hypothetical protein C4580_04085 [Candidatus Woesearchaeota archaeon]